MTGENVEEILELLRQIASAGTPRDGFDIANVVIAGVSAFATIALAAFAAYIAWKSHLFERSSARARIEGERFAMRERFLHAVEAHLKNMRDAWSQADRVKARSELTFDSALSLRTFAITMNDADGQGGFAISSAINFFDDASADWDKTKAPDFGVGSANLLIATILWARDPEAWPKSELGGNFLKEQLQIEDFITQVSIEL